ncbi:MAG: nucleotidyltransferase family protein [Methanosarcinales archaeon]
MNLSPESKVLLYCARKTMNEATKSKLKETLNNNLDWNYIMESASIHGISPLLYHNLSKTENNIPKEVMKKLKKHYYANFARNMFQYEELSKVLNSFKDAGIEVIVLKGAALAETVYKNIGLRSFSDIDILIKREDLQRSKKKMSELGYTLDEKVTPEEYNEKFGCDLFYFKQKNIIELHWNIARNTGIGKPVKIEIDKMWNNARSANIASVDVLVLSPEDLLLHSCIHLPKHRYERLIWFCDIYEIIKSYDINWNSVIEIAKKYRVKTLVYYGLYFTDKLLGPTIPEKVLKELKPPYFQRLLFIKLLENVLSNKRNVWYRFHSFTRFLLIDRTQDKLKYLLEYFFPPRGVLARSYSVPNSKKIYFYYFIHLKYLGFKGIKLLASPIVKPKP